MVAAISDCEHDWETKPVHTAVCALCGRDRESERIKELEKLRENDDRVIKMMQAQLAELRESRKAECVEFFHWWWNHDGTNTEQGYDDWAALLQGETQ